MSTLPDRPEDYRAWRQALKPDKIQEGEQFEAWLADLQISEAELSRRTGCVRSYIQQRRALLHATPDVIAAWEQGQIQFVDLREICAGAPQHDEAQRRALAMVLKLRKAKKRVDPKAVRNYARGASGR